MPKQIYAHFPYQAIEFHACNSCGHYPILVRARIIEGLDAIPIDPKICPKCKSTDTHFEKVRSIEDLTSPVLAHLYRLDQESRR
jgi:hypothetical protein